MIPNILEKTLDFSQIIYKDALNNVVKTLDLSLNDKDLFLLNHNTVHPDNLEIIGKKSESYSLVKDTQGYFSYKFNIPENITKVEIIGTIGLVVMSFSFDNIESAYKKVLSISANPETTLELHKERDDSHVEIITDYVFLLTDGREFSSNFIYIQAMKAVNSYKNFAVLPEGNMVYLGRPSNYFSGLKLGSGLTLTYDDGELINTDLQESRRGRG